MGERLANELATNSADCANQTSAQQQQARRLGGDRFRYGNPTQPDRILGSLRSVDAPSVGIEGRPDKTRGPGIGSRTGPAGIELEALRDQEEAVSLAACEYVNTSRRGRLAVAKRTVDRQRTEAGINRECSDQVCGEWARVGVIATVK